jgi:hypothetical protein
VSDLEELTLPTILIGAWLICGLIAVLMQSLGWYDSKGTKRLYGDTSDLGCGTLLVGLLGPISLIIVLVVRHRDKKM